MLRCKPSFDRQLHAIATQCVSNDKFWRNDDIDAAVAPSSLKTTAASVKPMLDEMDGEKEGFDFDEFLKSLFIDVKYSFNKDENCDILSSKYFKKGCILAGGSKSKWLFVLSRGTRRPIPCDGHGALVDAARCLW